jgi:hypothetical protein
VSREKFVKARDEKASKQRFRDDRMHKANGGKSDYDELKRGVQLGADWAERYLLTQDEDVKALILAHEQHLACPSMGCASCKALERIKLRIKELG